MKGFFYEEEIIKKEKAKKIKEYNCESCRLYRQCNSPKMLPTGKGGLNILIVAEAPGKKEDQLGKQMVGESGQLLREALQSGGYNLDKDFWKTNAVICRPPGNRKPNKLEIKCCRKKLMAFIKTKKPDKIIILGSTALESLTGETLIEKFVGTSIPDQELGCWIYPMYHPSFLLRNENDFLLKKQFKQNLLFAIEDEREFPIYSNIQDNIEIINQPFPAIIFLQGLNVFDESIISIDIETTGLKPYVKGHEIICISITVNTLCTKVFPVFEDKEFLFELKKVLTNKKIKKIAHNLKFENKWFENILKAKTKNWYWDTMIAAHVLDNGRGITGLKVQSYINFGIKGYENEISSYLKSSEKSSHAFNQIKECDINKLMLYCGMDSLLTYYLYEKQIENMSVEDFSAYDLLHKGTLEFCKIEQKGILIDKKYYDKKVIVLTKKMEALKNKIMNSKEVSKWDGKKEFKFNSNKDLPHLLFNILKIKSTVKTEKGNFSVSAPTLEKINNSFVKDIVKWRKMKKIRDTYIEGYRRESVNGIMYPSFHLNTTVTYRPSTSEPNFANVPKHEEIAKKLVRSGIIPSSGNQLVEVDYSGMEVRISACYHKDPVMVAYINNPDTDMHRDQASELFIMKKEEITKGLRSLAKGMFVFAQFYGDWWKSCAESVWSKIDDKTKLHLKENGIKGLGRLIKKDNRIVDATGYYKHVMEVENRFWNEKFMVYGQWKKDMWKKYQRIGYIKTLTNFTLRKKMSRKDVSNYPIQGSAFHCLLLAMIYMNKYLRKNKMKTRIIGQIYDSIVFDMCSDEKEKLKPIIRYVMTKKIRKKFNWIIVPLDIEMEVSEIDGNWYDMKEEKI